MTQCPKCGSRKIIGPKYHPSQYHVNYGYAITVPECLGYTCEQCGYSTTTPTKDAKASETAFTAKPVAAMIGSGNQPTSAERAHDERETS
jgi:hypothetical protein